MNQREHFLAILREKLAEPGFRQGEGFPIGDDREILALSEPPIYTACPNPFLAEVVQDWRNRHDAVAKPTKSACVDLSAGDKTEQAYLLHTYHSKIPPTTLATLIDHYTDSGSIILDPFAGSGMTAVAAGIVAERRQKELLCIQSDLSPAATFIANIYASDIDGEQLWQDGQALLAENAEQLAALYTDESGAFDYTIFSDIFICEHCATELVFWDECVDQTTWTFRKEFTCRRCGTIINKRRAIRQQATYLDPALNHPATQAYQLPVARKRGRHLELLNREQRLQALDTPKNYTGLAVPLIELSSGANLSQPQNSHGITHVHHLFTWRNLSAIAALWHGASHYPTANALRFVLTSFMLKTGSKLHNIGLKNGGINLAGQLPNTYYLPNLTAERNIGTLFANKLKQVANYFTTRSQNERRFCQVALSTASATQIPLADNSVDYCITDPPFGGFVNYAELNLVWEGWLGLQSARNQEAVVYEQGGKSHVHYRGVMTAAFGEIHRVLKPGCWLTLVFHNSSNAIWTLIQEALLTSGFVIADVRGLGRGQGSYKQMTAAVSVKTDLLVSAYKSVSDVAHASVLERGTESGLWTFIRNHLDALPILLREEEEIEMVAERQNYRLFDRMVAHHLQQGLTVPLSAAEFYAGLDQRFLLQDGMYFLPEQLAEYERRQMAVYEI